jgi:PIN domain nuclease of toxin-antitoxin system
MKLLLDTNIILKSALNQLSEKAVSYIIDESNELFFSPISILEVVIKRSGGDKLQRLQPRELLRNLRGNGYTSLPFTNEHALATEQLPLIHKDPFDRILISQAQEEGMTFITTDALLAEYPGSIILVK